MIPLRSGHFPRSCLFRLPYLPPSCSSSVHTGSLRPLRIFYYLRIQISLRLSALSIIPITYLTFISEAGSLSGWKLSAMEPRTLLPPSSWPQPVRQEEEEEEEDQTEYRTGLLSRTTLNPNSTIFEMVGETRDLLKFCISPPCPRTAHLLTPLKKKPSFISAIIIIICSSRCLLPLLPSHTQSLLTIAWLLCVYLSDRLLLFHNCCTKNHVTPIQVFIVFYFCYLRFCVAKTTPLCFSCSFDSSLLNLSFFPLCGCVGLRTSTGHNNHRLWFHFLFFPSLLLCCQSSLSIIWGHFTLHNIFVCW